MLRCATFLSLLAFAAPLPAQEAKAKRPNIVYIMSDDHASAAISAYGSFLGKYAKTPNIDRIAKGGVLFKNACVTNSICTPSRAAMLTGQYSHKNGVYTLNDVLDPMKIHIGHLLRQLGYQTAIIGKWHLATDPQGFDYWNILPGQGVYHDPKLRLMGTKAKELVNHPGKYSEDVITDYSLDWLKKRDKTKPFMLLCHYKAPHRPWDPAKRFADLYKDDVIPEPPTLLDDHQGRAKAVQDIRMVVGRDFSKRDLERDIPKDLDSNGLRKWAYQHYMKRYLACVAAVDENVGRLLDFLDQEGLANDTLVVYTSDQGFFLGEHGYYDKRLMYEPCLTTPLVVRYPGGAKAGQVSNDQILNVDHAPTFLDLAGAPVAPDMDGKSYKSILAGNTPAHWRTSMYYRYYMHLDGSHNVPAHYGVRTSRYTLIHFYNKGLGMKGASEKDLPPEWELYDRQQDPTQVRNLYTDPAHADVVRDLKKELERLRRELKDEK